MTMILYDLVTECLPKVRIKEGDLLIFDKIDGEKYIKTVSDVDNLEPISTDSLVAYAINNKRLMGLGPAIMTRYGPPGYYYSNVFNKLANHLTGDGIEFTKSLRSAMEKEVGEWGVSSSSYLFGIKGQLERYDSAFHTYVPSINEMNYIMDCLRNESEEAMINKGRTYTPDVGLDNLRRMADVFSRVKLSLKISLLDYVKFYLLFNRLFTSSLAKDKSPFIISLVSSGHNHNTLGIESFKDDCMNRIYYFLPFYYID